VIRASLIRNPLTDVSASEPPDVDASTDDVVGTTSGPASRAKEAEVMLDVFNVVPSDPSSQYRPHKFVILEALSATGLRSIRYAKEIPLVRFGLPFPVIFLVLTSIPQDTS
jgi:hypothetical protein